MGLRQRRRLPVPRCTRHLDLPPHATDLQVAIDCGDTGGQVALHALSIDVITRERIVDQKICFDRPYYRWRIAFNWPQGSEVRFGASDFTLDLRAEPVLQDQQQLSPLDRD